MGVLNDGIDSVGGIGDAAAGTGGLGRSMCGLMFKVGR
jgi:hypothetical protein